MQEQWPENLDVVDDSIQPSDDVRRQLIARLSRADTLPMIEQLATLIGCAPSPDAISEWSAHYPDRWANAVSVFAKLSGYTEKREVAIGVTLDLTRLSDSQLEQRIADQVAKLGLLPVKVVDAEVVQQTKLNVAEMEIVRETKERVAESALINVPRSSSQTIEHNLDE